MLGKVLGATGFFTGGAGGAGGGVGLRRLLGLRVRDRLLDGIRIRRLVLDGLGVVVVQVIRERLCQVLVVDDNVPVAIFGNRPRPVRIGLIAVVQVAARQPEALVVLD